MTFADDFAPIEGEELEAQSPWPVAFGVTFTPNTVGILLGVLGLAGAAAMAYYLALPAWTSLTELQGTRDQQAQQRDQLLAQIQRRQQLELEAQQAQVRRQQVLNLFASEDAVNTLLLDLNRQVQAREGAIDTYDPAEEPLQIVQDSSWGADVNGLLKRKQLAMEVTGTFNQVQNVLRSFEQLQAVLAIENMDLATTGTLQLRPNNQGRLVASEPPELRARFDITVLVPVSEEELAQQQAQQPAPGQPTPGQPAP